MLRELSEELGQGSGLMITNFPDDPGKRLILNSRVRMGDSSQLADMVGQEISPRFWAVHTVELMNETNGEISTCPRIVIVDHSDNTYQAVSHGVFESIKMIADAYGTAELPKTLSVKVVNKSTRKRYKMLGLEVVRA